LLHAIVFYERSGYHPDTLIVLQATSPFRAGKQIKEAIELFDDNCEMVVSVKETKANPYYTLREENEEGWLVKSKEGNFIRRQDCPRVFELNGAIYIMSVDSIKLAHMSNLKFVRGYVMEEIISHDIDTTFDWTIAEAILKKLT
jgi:CMP-N,N'-diacetyllegionaminic acid synthase